MTNLTRRAVLSSAAAATLSAPLVRPAWAATPELRALMWEAYLLPDVVTAFDATHQVKLVPSFFDGNSESCNKLRVGSANEFDLVQTDGFWPQLYFREGLIRAVDHTKASTTGYFPEFSAETSKVLTDPVSGAKLGFPFCWGAYCITYDAAVVAPDQTHKPDLRVR
ncbi:hypothetical protein [Cypionkella sp. TWP1-2-1b2]|uniref:hypothetical protein n=1 Tax=Cypionkella sp. TWP1-2-1b2 TaxID=2804675 RepID=UPI003CF64FC2